MDFTKLRRHQQDVIRICQEIMEGEPIKRVYLDCHPGSGKSGDSVLFARQLLDNGFDKICHVAPRKSLTLQIEKDMIDPFFESGRCIRAADNGENPSRGHDGFSITFQALASDHTNIAADFRKHRYILILDEVHHATLEGTWKESIEELINLAGLTVMMTGTSFRNNNEQIAFFPYKKNGKLDKRESKNVRWVTYSRKDALKERAIVPLKVDFIDGKGVYRKNGGPETAYLTISRKELKVAAKSDYAFQVIDHKMIQFKAYHDHTPQVQMILVAPDIETARAYGEHIQNKYNYKCESVDSKMPNSSEIISRFRGGGFEILSSCAQAYEGLDAPNTAFMLILTHIRSEPWLTQCVNRATRYKKWKEVAYITVPPDPEFKSFLKRWEEEASRYGFGKEESESPEEDSPGGDGDDIEIIEGQALLDHIQTHNSAEPELDLTPSQKEKRLRHRINDEINKLLAKESKKTGNIVHTETLRRRKIIFRHIYLRINRRCQLKEMTHEELTLALGVVLDMQEAPQVNNYRGSSDIRPTFQII